MAITQSRLLSILEAAEYYQARADALLAMLSNMAREREAGTLTLTDAMRRFEYEIMGAHDTKHYTTIAVERNQYKHTHKRNEWLKEHKTNQRRAMGVRSQYEIQIERIYGSLDGSPNGSLAQPTSQFEAPPPVPREAPCDVPPSPAPLSRAEIEARQAIEDDEAEQHMHETLSRWAASPDASPDAPSQK